MPPRFQDPLARYKSRYRQDPTTGCWNWTAAIAKNGYAIMSIRARATYVHRWAFEHFTGRPIPADHQIHHVCENKRCVNPAHLVALPASVHNSINPVHHRKRSRTECQRGHPFNRENTYVNSAGSRVCKTCRRENVRRHYDRHLRSTDKFKQPRRSEPGGPIDHRASD